MFTLVGDTRSRNAHLQLSLLHPRNLTAQHPSVFSPLGCPEEIVDGGKVSGRNFWVPFDLWSGPFHPNTPVHPPPSSYVPGPQSRTPGEDTEESTRRRVSDRRFRHRPSRPLCSNYGVRPGGIGGIPIKLRPLTPHGSFREPTLGPPYVSPHSSLVRSDPLWGSRWVVGTRVGGGVDTRTLETRVSTHDMLLGLKAPVFDQDGLPLYLESWGPCFTSGVP